MTTHAYDEQYLHDAMNNLGEAFDYAVNTCSIKLADFIELFIASGYARAFGNGSPKLVSGLSGTELVMSLLEESGLKIASPNPAYELDRAPEYWCGWILAYYQWRTGRTFKDIAKHISAEDLIKLYPTLHEAAEDKFVDTVNEMIKRETAPTRLQSQRKACGYSQSELSAKSGVKLRTLQQYERRAKDINKAGAAKLFALSSALGCNAQDLLEYDINNT